MPQPGDGTPSDGAVRAADAASAVARALVVAGYQPRQLSVTTSENGELVLTARLREHTRRQPAAAGLAFSQEHRRGSRARLFARLAVGVILGLLLGFLGLPRLDAPRVDTTINPAVGTPALPEILPVQDLAVTRPDPPAPVPQPTPASPLFDRPLNAAIPGWPNDPRGTAWFSSDGYRLFAREVEEFVAIGIPISRPVKDVTVGATFRKVGGPPGGGYGLILRDQSPSSQRDGHNQTGTYLVFEVGDRGEIGVWQRDQTRWLDLVAWRRADSVHTDQAPNSLMVAATGNRLTFQVNGEIVADLNYDKLPASGGVGIFVGGDLNVVALERLRIDNT